MTARDMAVDFGDLFKQAAVEALTDPAVLAEVAARLERPLVVTPDQAAGLLQVSRRTVDKWLAAGLLPRLPHTTKILIPRIGLEAFAAGRDVSEAS